MTSYIERNPVVFIKQVQKVKGVFLRKGGGGGGGGGAGESSHKNSSPSFHDG